LTLYFIPKNIIDLNEKGAFFYTNLLLVGCVLGVVFISQSASMPLCKLYLKLVFLLKPADKKLKPIVVKNLESHSLKNLNANLLYSITVCFLIFQSTNFLAIKNYITQSITAIFGGDISLFAIDEIALPKFEELKIKAVLDKLKSEDFGLVDSYTINSSPLRRQFNSPGEDQVQDFILGDGLRWSKSKISGKNGMMSQAVEKEVFRALRTEDVWWPSDFMEQPLGSGTRTYTEPEIMHMIYDIEAHSKF
jgi:hypothetical protein